MIRLIQNKQTTTKSQSTTCINNILGIIMKIVMKYPGNNMNVIMKYPGYNMKIVMTYPGNNMRIVMKYPGKL